MEDKSVVKAWAKMLNCSVEDLGDSEFFFEKFNTEEEVDQAWALIPEHKAIRERIARVDGVSATPQELGAIPAYNFPSSELPKDDEMLPKLLGDYFKALIPIAERAEDAELLALFRSRPAIVLATSGQNKSIDPKYDLSSWVYDLHTQPILEHLPDDKPHYSIVYNYAVYLTKDDRVTAYVMWPCLKDNAYLEKAYDLGFELWKRNADFWADKSRKTVYIARKGGASRS